MQIFGFDILSLFDLTNIAVILLGSFVGILIGALPGMGTLIAIVLVLPITFTLPPLAAVLLLLSVYQGSEYGGSISAVVLGIPGTPAASATLLDGNAMARNGAPGKALAYSLDSSTIGGLAGGLVLIFLTEPLGEFSLRFSAPDFFLIGIFGLLAVATLNSKDITKGLISLVLGLMAGTVGIDLMTGASRFTVGRIELMDGINTLALVIGAFAFPEIFTMISDSLHERYTTDKKSLNCWLTLKEYAGIFKSTTLGCVVGSIVGIFPGLGAATSAWFAYILEKKTSRHPEKYGTGIPAGIAAPEAANNATVGGALLPLLALGIPGSSAIAIIMSAFMIHGIQPGPGVFASRPQLVYGILFGFMLTSIAMWILGKTLTPLFARVLTVPNSLLVPAILILTIVGGYADKGIFFNLWFALGFGVIAYFMKKLDYSLPTFILAFILCPIAEENFQRSLMLSRGSYSIFYQSTYSKVILFLLIAVIIVPAVQKLISVYKNRSNKAAAA